MIWIKDGGGAIGSNYCYTQNFEYMFVFTKGKPQHINLLKDKPNLSYGKVRKDSIGRRNEQGKWKEHDKGKVVVGQEFSKRNNWWKVVPQKQEGSDFHPAVFPEKLVCDHIISWSNENDLVYDPFMGSGTTAKCCHMLKRNWIGSEISKEYFDKANERIFKAQQQLTLF